MNRKRRPRIRSRRDFLLAHSPDPRLRLLYRIRHAVGWLCVIVTVAFLVMNLQLLTPDSVKSIRSSLKAASAQSASDTTTISYPSSSPDAIIPFGNALAICDNGNLTIELPGSYTQMETEMSYADPVLRASDRYLLTFDRGANRFTVSNTLTQLFTHSTRSSISSADIANNGNVAVVTDEAGYKSAVTVYNVDNEQLYKWSSSDYYIMSAALSPDGSRLALFCFQQDGLTLTSKLFFTDISTNAAPEQSVDMNGSLCAGLTFLGRSTVCAVCDNGVYVVSRSGSVRYSQTYSSDDLIAFDMSSHDNVALCTTSYSQEGRAEILLVNSRGVSTRTPLVLEEEPDSISYCDGRLAVLTGDTVTFYNRSLRPIDEQTGLSGASAIYMRSGNLCIASFSSYARVLTIGQPLADLNSTAD